MSGPEIVRIKRKRSAAAPDTLVVERSKRRNIEHIHYIRKKEDEELHGRPGSTHASRWVEPLPSGAGTVINNNSVPSTDTPMETDTEPLQPNQTLKPQRRIFHLRRSTQANAEANSKKRKANEYEVATFIESKPNGPGSSGTSPRDSSKHAAPAAPAVTLKRPGKNAAIRNMQASSTAQSFPAKRQHQHPTAHSQQIADSLHQFALDEAAKDNQPPTLPKPRITSTPKISAARSRELHRQRTSPPQVTKETPDSTLPPSADTEMDLDVDADADSDNGEYVFDTYILAPNSGSIPPSTTTPHPAPSSTTTAPPNSAPPSDLSVGYLIITDSDLPTWELYTAHADSDSSHSGADDEDDENAEDWYGADYPDDEVASDDEFGQNPYQYRAGGPAGGNNSDEEEWGIAGSDEGSEDDMSWSDREDERMMNPFHKKTARQFEKYLESSRGAGAGAGAATAAAGGMDV